MSSAAIMTDIDAIKADLKITKKQAKKKAKKAKKDDKVEKDGKDKAAVTGVRVPLEAFFHTPVPTADAAYAELLEVAKGALSARGEGKGAARLAKSLDAAGNGGTTVRRFDVLTKRIAELASMKPPTGGTALGAAAVKARIYLSSMDRAVRHATSTGGMTEQSYQRLRRDHAAASKRVADIEAGSMRSMRLLQQLIMEDVIGFANLVSLAGAPAGLVFPLYAVPDALAASVVAFCDAHKIEVRKAPARKLVQKRARANGEVVEEVDEEMDEDDE